jgi:hypothetical protein
VQALSAGCLAEAHQSDGFQAIMHLAGRFDHDLERNLWPRIEIKDQATGHLRPVAWSLMTVPTEPDVML